jgi:hypothetical protein
MMMISPPSSFLILFVANMISFFFLLSCFQKEMEATGKTDNLKTIVGMLLKKDKQQTQQDDPLMFRGADDNGLSIPQVAVTAAPESPIVVTPDSLQSESPDPTIASGSPVSQVSLLPSFSNFPRSRKLSIIRVVLALEKPAAASQPLNYHH